MSAQTKSQDYRLTLLLRDGSLRTMWLSDARSLSFVDPQLRAQLQSYLDVLAEGRQDVTRQISVYPVPSAGPIRVAYLQQFPLWKTSYRVDMSDGDSRIQGWAQIDNPTGESWDNVQVSLLSGSPVSFRMDLYQPLYASRSVVAVPGVQVAPPRQYEATLKTATLERSVLDNPAVGNNIWEMAQMVPAIDMYSDFNHRAASVSGSKGAVQNYMSVNGQASSNNALMVDGMPAGPIGGEALNATFTPADTQQLRDAYEYTFPFPVRLASRQSALLPFVQKPLKIERLSIFNARADRSNPRLGARLENNTGTPLEPGPVTFFDAGRYAGETVFGYIPRGAKQLVGYGVDHEVLISSQQKTAPETTTRLTINKGVAVFYKESVFTTTYVVRNNGDRKTVIIEHPRTAVRTLRGEQPWETTDGFLRFRIELRANEVTELPVVETIEQRVDVTLEITREQLAMFAGAITPEQLRVRLGDLVDRQEHLDGLEAEASALEERRVRIFRDQERLRNNLASLGHAKADGALRKRYLDQLSAQEDELTTMRTGITQLATQIDEGRQQLAAAIGALTFDSASQP